jgi:hypothetical protein
MRKLLMACLVALPLAAIPSQARAWFGHCSSGDCDGGGHHCLTGHCHCGGHQWFHGHGGHGGIGLGLGSGEHEKQSLPQAGPWYLYWPYAAHFQTPAPLPYPYYSPTQVLPPNFQGGSQPAQPVGYYPEGSPPPYWQGR